jgi:DNA-directed RNA polymerase subunit M/transcription elongation factor TFIIS
MNCASCGYLLDISADDNLADNNLIHLVVKCSWCGLRKAIVEEKIPKIIKEKKMTKKKVVKEEKSMSPSIWDQLVESVNEDNKEAVLLQLGDAVEFLETTGDQELATKFKDAIKRIG